jgi:hypothetical protein
LSVIRKIGVRIVVARPGTDVLGLADHQVRKVDPAFAPAARERHVTALLGRLHHPRQDEARLFELACL